MTFTEQGVTAMHAELVANRKRDDFLLLVSHL